MKVCHVTMHYSPRSGGQELYIGALVEILTNNGIDSLVVQPYRIDGEKDDKILYLKNFPKFHLFQNFISNAQWFAFNISLFFAKKNLKQSDIVISNYPFHYPVLKWHKRVIVLSHGVLWRAKMDTIFDRVHKQIGLNLPTQRAFIVANDTHFLREIGYKIESATGFFTKVFPRVWFIPNCVDTFKFKPDDKIQRENRILIPRNIRQERGIHLAIESFAKFNDKNPLFKLIIVGGPKHGAYYEYCVKLTQELDIEDRVDFVGFLTGDLLLAEYQKSKICLIPTIELEGTSLSALEAMSCGTPTVCTDIAGLKDLPAILSEPSPEDISFKIVNALDNWDYYSVNQRNSVIKTFNLENWKNAWLQVLEDVYNDNR
ncbi:MAG: glycosyltransferase family 4 protein [Cytophagales bacterium]|nr:glycosyltransferase family 4 protein [Cytophagales bacterium]